MVRIVSLWVATGALVVAGCNSGPWTQSALKSGKQDASGEPVLAQSREGTRLATDPIQQAGAITTPQSAVQNANTAIAPLTGSELDHDDGVLRELQLISAVDPVAAQQLVAQLGNVKPSLRPLVARQFRTSWEYHRQLTSDSESSMLTNAQHPPGAQHVAQLPVDYQPAVVPPVDEPAATNAPVVTPQPAEPVLAPDSTTTSAPSRASLPAPVAEPQARSGAAVALDSEVAPAKFEAEPKLMPAVDEQLIAPVPMVDEPRDWQDVLLQTIDRLDGDLAEDPRNTSEAYQHVRMRLLQLAAGNRDLALAPIPGLTPTEQTYWSNQLFSIATLLDHEGQPDDQRRASVAADQLGEASAKLGELSSLSISSLVFCKKVFGFGDYEEPESKGFEAGQSVTLYAEIDNFRSESTEQGYHTSLATSYEVLDQAGNRVEGGEFANVDDYCRKKRNDFYIEYTFQLPSRIYASNYQLRLLIRDRLSGKIGKATADFEIHE